jgi:hypothetical protein
MEVLKDGDPGPVTGPHILVETDIESNNLKRCRRSDQSKWKRNVAKHMYSAHQP